MSSELRRVLKSFLTSRKKEALRKNCHHPPEWVLYNNAGNLIDINHLGKQVFHKILEKAGLRKIRMHDMRHTYATLRI
jgi:integrase